MATQSALVPVEFHGATLSASIIDGAPCVAIRPIVEALGLDWASQFTRIKRHPVLSATVVVTTTVAEDGKNREMIRCAANPAVQGRVKSADGKAVLVVWIGFNAASAAARCTGE